MGFLKNTLKGAVVAKVATEARKPENQARAKSAFASLRRRVSGQGPATPGATGRSARAAARKGTADPR